MAKAGAGKPTRDEKKAARAAKRAQGKQTRANLFEAFTMTRKEDPRFLPYLIMLVVGVVAVLLAVGLLTTHGTYALVLTIVVAILGGVVAGMLLFSRRAQRMTYAKADGTPGAAVWVLQNQLRGDWRTEQAVAGTAQLDAVHRLIGRPGIILVGEGAPHRVRGLVAQEKKKIARVAGETPIYDVIVGNGEGEVPLRKLNLYLNKLPRNLTKADIGGVEKRLQALDSRRTPLPQGPMPAGAKMRNVQRAARRRS